MPPCCAPAALTDASPWSGQTSRWVGGWTGGLGEPQPALRPMHVHVPHTLLHLHSFNHSCRFVQGREEILRVHINQRGLPLGEDVRVDQLAAQVGGLMCGWVGQAASALSHSCEGAVQPASLPSLSCAALCWCCMHYE
jgi:hypothetical protein